MGRVNKPGEIIMGHELTVMQALSLAGGVTPFASLNSVHVFSGAKTVLSVFDTISDMAMWRRDAACRKTSCCRTAMW
ncbi:MAG: hypothetical protein U1F34_06240 [Gammaproteobacteria bacterium]